MYWGYMGNNEKEYGNYYNNGNPRYRFVDSDNSTAVVAAGSSLPIANPRVFRESTMTGSAACTLQGSTAYGRSLTYVMPQ